MHNMQVTKRHWAAAGAGLGLMVLVLFVWSHREQAATPGAVPLGVATSTEHSTTDEPGTTQYAGPFLINAADAPITWTFKGVYAGNDTLVQQANTDIAHLAGLVGKGSYDDYDLYNGLGNDYTSLGEGKKAYDNYNRAIAIHPRKGLVYSNLGHLMDELHAYRTAADAYAKAVAVEPVVLEYHLARLNYLTRQFPTDTELLVTAFADADKQFGGIAQVLAIQAKWFESQGRYADAVTAWQHVKTLSPGRDMTAVDAAIARDQAKASLTQ